MFQEPPPGLLPASVPVPYCHPSIDTNPDPPHSGLLFFLFRKELPTLLRLSSSPLTLLNTLDSRLTLMLGSRVELIRGEFTKMSIKITCRVSWPLPQPTPFHCESVGSTCAGLGFLVEGSLLRQLSCPGC